VPRANYRKLAVYASFPFLGLLLVRLLVVRHYSARIYDPREAPPRGTAIVFGAGLRRDGTPTAVLADRVAAAADLYRLGRVHLLLLSGSTRPGGYDEPEAMRLLAMELGVPPEAILTDAGGTRTYASCARARDIFGVRQALLVSQAFHLPRALSVCEALGVIADGAAADLRTYSVRSRTIWELREIAATAVALWEAHIVPSIRPAPPGSEASPYGS
jgi:vancomycin permeability regulator SanA